MLLLLTFDTEDERELFNYLYQGYSDFMLRVAFHILHNHEDAEDVVHNAFLYVADNLDKINISDRQKTKSYLALITKHKAIDLIRTRHSEIPLEDYMAVLGRTVNWENEEFLSEAFLYLSEEYRNLLLLRFYYGYSIAKIAAMQHMSYMAAAQMLHRAKLKLAQVIAEQE